MTAHASHFIGGSWLHSDTAYDSVNPADGSLLGKADAGTAEVALQAVAAARQAFFSLDWAAAPRQRAAALHEFADRMAAREDELTALLLAEGGKLHAEAAGEVHGAISEARYYAGLARAIHGRTYESEPGNLSLLTREAAGVAAIIVPWNAPIGLLVRSLGPALAAGCTVVIKPAVQTPLINAAIIACLADCPSLPAGVINSVNEDGAVVGQALVAAPHVDVVSFTGASSTGSRIMAAAAPSMKRLSLELGGKTPAIVFDDADMALAIQHLVRGSLILTGQMCVAAARFLVHEGVRDAFEAGVKAAYEATRVGPGTDPQSQMAALIDHDSRDRITSIIAQAEDEGTMITRGTPLDGPGAFVTPTLFRIEDTASPLVQEEHFGPIASVETFTDEAEAVQKANATTYGLAASVFTQDTGRAVRVARALRSGTVWLNSHAKLLAEAETGGFGRSGVGRLHGIEGLNDFLETKHIYLEAGQITPAVVL